MKNIKASRRIRAKISGTAERPRLCLAVSNTNLRAQLIDDATAKTLISVSTVSASEVQTKSMSEKAQWLGKQMADAAHKAKLTKVVFDRGGKIYHGRVKAFAEAARQAGMEF